MSGDFPNVVIDGKTYSYTVRKRKGQKYIRLKIGTDGSISVSAPAGTTDRRIEEMVAGKRAWMVKQLKKREEAAAPYDPLKRIPYDGEWYGIEHAGRGKRGSVSIDEDSRVIRIDSVSDDPKHLKKIIAGKLKSAARTLVAEKTAFWSERLGIPFVDFSVRDQKTRWGSSSGKGHISVNWRIVCLPEEVRDYLIVHELLHQKIHNHGKDFWKELERILPGAKKCDRWLKHNDMIMSLYRSS